MLIIHLAIYLNINTSEKATHKSTKPGSHISEVLSSCFFSTNSLYGHIYDLCNSCSDGKVAGECKCAVCGCRCGDSAD